MQILETGIKINEKGSIERPLPFKEGISFKKNKTAVFQRSASTLGRISNDLEKTAKCVKAMGKYIGNGHVEQLPRNEQPGPYENYLPVFPVTKTKNGKVLLVFDSAARYEGQSLNDVLLQGPDETNRIVGVLVRFRQKEVGYAADLECMFHSFYVSPPHRDAMRFFWWSNNDPSQRLATYRANVHVFGNCCSPAISTYSLRYITELPHAKDNKVVSEFIYDNFYVDDGLRSDNTVEEAISTLSATDQVLSKVNVNIHKIISSDPNVIKAFPSNKIADNIDSVDISHSSLQYALGVTWNVSTDCFQVTVNVPKRDFTRRGVLSVNGSLYDPLGFASPVSLTGKLLQRKFLAQSSHSSKPIDWDEPLSEEFRESWDEYINQIDKSRIVTIPRCYHPKGFGEISTTELHVFIDASSNAIGHVLYLRETNATNEVAVSFLFASSKISLRSAVSIPRMELCAAADAAQTSSYIASELKRPIDRIQFYSDSSVTLGYINNEKKRFSRYVTSRVETILKYSRPNQWQYISTSINPADIATRPHSPNQLMSTKWFTGPEFLKEADLDQYRENSIPASVDLPEETATTKVLVAKNKVRNPVLSRLFQLSND